MSVFGIGVGSLKYLIVESNITLFIEALKPLSEKKNSIIRIGTDSNFKNHQRALLSNWKYCRQYLNNCIAIITKNKFVIKNSMGDLTNPHAKVDENFAGSAIDPDRNNEGKSTTKINTLNAAKYITRRRSLSDLYFILKNSFLKLSPIKIDTSTTKADWVLVVILRMLFIVTLSEGL
jgi:hypothetical protein